MPLKTQSQKLSFPAFLAKLALVLFIFFLFFGTSLPFRERAEDVEDIGTSNIVNQLAFGGLFIISAIALIPKRKELLQLSKQEKFLTAFFLWCLISIIWSEHSFVWSEAALPVSSDRLPMIVLLVWLPAYRLILTQRWCNLP